MSLRSYIFLLGVTAAVGCGDEISRGGVHGRVTLGERPLDAGRILFVPEPPLAGPTVSAPIVAGGYVLPSREGPIVGRHRVEVEGAAQLGFPLDDEQAFIARGGRPLPPNPVPPEFNRRSVLSAEIKPGDNTFDVAVPLPR